MIVVLAPNLTVIYIGGFVIGAGAGIFYTANWALGTELVPQAEAARYLGIANIATAGGSGIARLLGGALILASGGLVVWDEGRRSPP